MKPRSSRLDHLRLRSLVLLSTLAETSSLRRAAGIMNVTQPALSAMLRDLEEAFGQLLFERSSRGLKLTAAGDYLLRQAELVLADLDRVRDELGAGAAGHSNLRVGSLPLAMIEIVPNAVAAMRRNLPQLHISLSEGSVRQLIELLVAGDLDVVVGRLTTELASHDGLEQIQLFSERICAIGAPAHPLARRRKPSWGQLAASGWVLPPPDTQLRQLFIDSFQRRGLTPPAASYESRSFYTNVAIVNATDCLTVAPLTVAQHYRRHRDVGILKISFGAPSIPVSIIKRRARIDTAGATAFIRAVQSVVRSTRTAA